MADRYSFSLTTFSPSGKLVQIEYALSAVNQGITSLGIKCGEGVVLATEKPLPSTLLLPDDHSKISQITPNAAAVYSGLSPDYRVLIDKARKNAVENYKKIYGVVPPTRILVQDIARVMQEATQSGGVRPYGVSLLVAGWDIVNGPSLYQVDPSGAYFPWKATAIGRNSTSAKTFLEKRFSDLSLEDAVHVALLTLKEGMEGEMNGDTVEICVVGPERLDLLGYEGVEGKEGPRVRVLPKEEIQDYLDNL